MKEQIIYPKEIFPIQEYLHRMPQEPMSAYLSFGYQLYGKQWQQLTRKERQCVTSAWKKLSLNHKQEIINVANKEKKQYLRELSDWMDYYQIEESELPYYQREYSKLKNKKPIKLNSLKVTINQLKEKSQESQKGPLNLKDLSKQSLSEESQRELLSSESQQAIIKEEETSLQPSLSKFKQKSSNKLIKQRKKEAKIKIKRQQELNNITNSQESKTEKQGLKKYWIQSLNNLKLPIKSKFHNPKDKSKTHGHSEEDRKGEKATLQDFSQLKKLMAICFGQSQITLNINGVIKFQIDKK